jgi:hypothetical protein
VPTEPRVVASAPPRPEVHVARRAEPARPPEEPAAAAAQEPPPSEPPPALAAQPDLFVELPILRNMEKLDHFEAIRTTTLQEAPAPPGEQGQSNG